MHREVEAKMPFKAGRKRSENENTHGWYNSHGGGTAPEKCVEKSIGLEPKKPSTKG